ncbi:CynX/NimT family MFS transporter [Labedaea rhizosphaerae]|uniref:CynX/NimT family MFS transporter n=1 Tax=Labedaea rhizosphaerae TaxID=598644 RepID=UPI001AADE04D|nr:MFS transporter [Labedaea rhizosphaerae]
MRHTRYGLLFVGVLLIAANLRAAITSVGPVLSDLRADLGLSGTVASILTSTPVFAFAALSPVAPAVAARMGIERALGLSLAVLSVGVVIRSVPGTALLWTGTVLLGAAIALINVLLPSLVKRDYPDAVGKTTGLYSSVQSGTAAVASGLAVPIAGVAQQGWRLSLGIWAGLAVIAFAVFLPQLRSRTLPAVTPAARGRTPWRSLLGWEVTLFMGFQSTVYYTMVTWWPSIERDHGVSATAAGWHLFVLQMMSIVGNLGTATMLHRRTAPGERAIAVTITGLLFLSVGGELLAPGVSLLWAAASGVGVGCCIVYALSLFGLRTRNSTQAAALSGMAQSVGYLLAGLGPVLFSLLHDATGGWKWPLAILLALVVGQMLLAVLVSKDRYVADA